MRKIIVAALLAGASFAASALTPWQVQTTNAKTGAAMTYTILPGTAHQASDNANEWFVAAEFEEEGLSNVTRFIVFVNGCIEYSGQTIWTTLQRKQVFPEAGTSDWMWGGGRVFDKLASLACSANYENFKDRLPQQGNQQKKPVSKNFGKDI